MKFSQALGFTLRDRDKMSTNFPGLFWALKESLLSRLQVLCLARAHLGCRHSWYLLHQVSIPIATQALFHHSYPRTSDPLATVTDFWLQNHHQYKMCLGLRKPFQALNTLTPFCPTHMQPIPLSTPPPENPKNKGPRTPPPIERDYGHRPDSPQIQYRKEGSEGLQTTD